MSHPNRPSDELLLQMLREGKHDSEIAVRLGVTTGELRERRADLRNRLGTERYQLLTGTESPRVRSTPKWLFFWGMGIAAGLLGLLLLVANIFAGEESPDVAAFEPANTTVPTARPTSANPAASSIDGLDFDDAGPFFSLVEAGSAASPISVENRANVAVVAIETTAYLTKSDVARWNVSGAFRDGLRLTAAIGGRPLTVTVLPDSGTTNLRELGASVGPVAEVSREAGRQAGAIMVYVTGFDGRRYVPRITSDGRLLISARPVPGDWVVDNNSGARLDVSGAQRFGRFSSLAQFTSCQSGSGELACSVSASSGNDGTFLAPAAGELSCRNNLLTYEAAGLRVVFGRRSGAADCSGRGGAVVPGDAIVGPGNWSLLAFDGGGGALSTAVAQDGTVYIGPIRGDAACPCISPP